MPKSASRLRAHAWCFPSRSLFAFHRPPTGLCPDHGRASARPSPRVGGATSEALARPRVGTSSEEGPNRFAPGEIVSDHRGSALTLRRQRSSSRLRLSSVKKIWVDDQGFHHDKTF